MIRIRPLQWFPASCPQITAPLPSGVITNSSPTISASFSDAVSGIDTGSVTVSLDGNPLGGCTVTAAHASCPATSLAQGNHTISGFVSDNAGNSSPINGSFGVATSPKYWTWYDMQSPGSTNWILVANTGDQAVNYQIKIHGEVMPTGGVNPGTIPAHSMVAPIFPDKRNGPVEVIADHSVMVSQRVVWNGYFNEVLGTVLE